MTHSSLMAEANIKKNKKEKKKEIDDRL